MATSSAAARAMDFYSSEGKVVRRDEGVCFGWWLTEPPRTVAAAPSWTLGPPPQTVAAVPSWTLEPPPRTVAAAPSWTLGPPPPTVAAAPSWTLGPELRVEVPSDDEDQEVGSLMMPSPREAAYQSLTLVQRLSPSSVELARLVDRRSPTHRSLEAVLNVPVFRGAQEKALGAELVRPVACRPVMPARGRVQWFSSPRRRELDRSSSELENSMRILQGKLRTVKDNHRRMMLDVDTIHQELQTAMVTTSRLTKAARSLVDELQDVRYLDELISMMEGHLDQISLRVWPFTTAHVTLGPDTCEEYNLVV